MAAEPELTLGDRVAFSFLGAFTGALYGSLLALAIFVATENGHPNIIGWSAGVFGCLGFFYGNFIVEAFLAIIHFLWGLLSGIFEQPAGIQAIEAPTSHLRAFMLVGFGTGIVIVLWSYF